MTTPAQRLRKQARIVEALCLLCAALFAGTLAITLPAILRIALWQAG